MFRAIIITAFIGWISSTQGQTTINVGTGNAQTTLTDALSNNPDPIITLDLVNELFTADARIDLANRT